MVVSEIFFVACIMVFTSWIVFAIGFFTRRQHGKVVEKARDRSALAGLILEAVGYALVFSIRRDFGRHVFDLSTATDIIFFILASLLAPASTWLALRAVAALGKHWSLEARTITGHDLIISGPYKIVRHPIYAAMFGLMISTGILITHPLILIVAIILFIAGTVLRIHAEEKLLVGYFGDKYFDYIKRTRAFIPFIW